MGQVQLKFQLVKVIKPLALNNTQGIAKLKQEKLQ
jgi:hypothetical protein